MLADIDTLGKAALHNPVQPISTIFLTDEFYFSGHGMDNDTIRVAMGHHHHFANIYCYCY